jgi:hypothetical protein
MTSTLEAGRLGDATGLWGERRAPKAFAHHPVTPRVISLQNRMRMTQSPRRASTPPVTPQASTDNGVFLPKQIAQPPWLNTFFQ